jgi:hypothetical protein
MPSIKKSYKKIPSQAIEKWVMANFDAKKRKGKNGYELVIANPFYDNDKKKFNISLSEGVCHDWRGDEWAGSVNPETGKRDCSFMKFVRLYLKCSYKEALEALLGTRENIKEYLKPENRIVEEEAKKKFSVRLPDGVDLLSEADDKQASAITKWLVSRGYTTTEIADKELYYSAMTVYWPYFEFDTLVYWQSRSRMNKRFEFPSMNIYDKQGKIVGVVDGSKGDYLYGFDNVEPASYIIIVEAIFCQNTVINQALASGGAVLTENQIKKLKILGPRDGVILAPDNDKAGIKSLFSNTAMLQKHGFKVFASIPPKIKYGSGEHTKDWNDLFTKAKKTKKEIREILDENIFRANRQNLAILKTKLLKD